MVSCRFCSKFRTLSSGAKIENWLRFGKVTENLKVGTFLKHSLDILKVRIQNEFSGARLSKLRALQGDTDRYMCYAVKNAWSL